uniref:type II toxin-antitoxin system HicA family toxin n=1 Tax=uncultured Sphingomonas sp. TaxID=158754 RepID=UPI0025FCEE3C|nr:type II toxin-antitoxin system HicA family toxin [uncultured Sphingomonas sp.]
MVQGYSKLLKSVLSERGWSRLRSGKGDHEIWAHPDCPKPIVVDNRIMSRHTANAVLKQAGILLKF